MSVHVRTLRPDDGPLLDAVLAGLSPQSRYLRFHSPMPRVPADTRRALLDVDGDRHIALVALAGPGEPVGIARVVRFADRPGTAEVAFEVVDAWRRRGVGRRLLTAVAERAAAAGITRLQALVLAENRPALALIRDVFPLCLSHRDGAVVELTALLDGAEITMDDILADLAA